MAKRYVDAADAAKMLRRDLAGKFPGQKFSVKTSKYSGGASITVRWVDGPRLAEVEPVAKFYEGSEFDGMIDLKSSAPDVIVDGERVHFMSDYVFCERDLSGAAQLNLARALEERYGIEFDRDRTYPTVCGYSGWSLLRQMAEGTGLFESREEVA